MDYTLKVEALKSGTVIDHIPAGQGRRVLKLFRLSESGERIYIGFNLPSQRIGCKDLIQLANIQPTPEEANQLALFAPCATVNVIQDFQIAKKYQLGLPEVVTGMLNCPNTNCITHNEPVTSQFRVSQRSGEVRLKCKYCEKTFARDTFEQLK